MSQEQLAQLKEQLAKVTEKISTNSDHLKTKDSTLQEKEDNLKVRLCCDCGNYRARHAALSRSRNTRSRVLAGDDGPEISSCLSRTVLMQC